MIITKERRGTFLYLFIDNFTSIKYITSSLGKASLYAYYENDYLYILSLFTKPQYRGNKFASNLLNRSIYEARKNKCTKIKLMDTSDFFNKENNIYIKHGFTYDNYGQPEMTLYI